MEGRRHNTSTHPSFIHPSGVHTRSKHAEFVCVSAACGSVPDLAERSAPHREDAPLQEKTLKQETPPVVEAGGVPCWVVRAAREWALLDSKWRNQGAFHISCATQNCRLWRLRVSFVFAFSSGIPRSLYLCCTKVQRQPTHCSHVYHCHSCPSIEQTSSGWASSCLGSNYGQSQEPIRFDWHLHSAKILEREQADGSLLARARLRLQQQDPSPRNRCPRSGPPCLVCPGSQR